jgi:hypothetical protein
MFEYHPTVNEIRSRFEISGAVWLNRESSHWFGTGPYSYITSVASMPARNSK